MNDNRFRVWCKNKKEWEKDKCFIDNKGILYQVIDTYPGYMELSEENHIVEFSTGLEDINGKEIFEGDIVSITNTDDDNEILSEVTWGGEDYPAFDLSNYDGYGMNGFSAIYHSSIGEKIEILGNIHKNPKLLEVLDD